MGYKSLGLLVTTYCNLKCPDCCYRLADGMLGKPQHYSWEYFEHAAKYLKGLPILYVSGGEPTLHPEFHRIAHEFRAMFNPKSMVLVTNGTGPLECYRDSGDCFDHIFVGLESVKYTKGEEWLSANLPRKTSVRSGKRPMDVPGGGGACFRYWHAAYANGRLHPCCVGPGLPDSTTIEPSEDWEEKLSELPRPCAGCAFSSGRPK